MKTSFTRRAEAFAAALDNAAAGAPTDPAVAAVAPLVHLAGRLATLPQRPMPTLPGVRAELLTAAAAPAAPVAPAAPAATAAATAATSSTTVTAATGTAGQIVAGALSVAVALSGVGAAAARSNPGDLFYGLRDLVTGAPAPANGPLDRAGELSASALDQVAALRRLLASGDLDAAARARVDQLVAELSASLNGVLDRLSADVAPERLVAEVTAAWNELAELVPALPADTQRAALDLLTIVNNRLGAVVDGASPVNGGTGRPTPPPAPSATASPSRPAPTPSPSAVQSTPAPSQSAPPSVPVPTVTAIPTSPPITPTTIPVPPGDAPTGFPLPVLPS